MENDLAVQIAEALIKRFEGCRLRPYLCPAGVPTIFYGATFYKDGTRVTLHDPAGTLGQAKELLIWQIRTVYLPAVLKLCPCINTPSRLAAIIDFTFNLGAGRLKSSTLRKRINSGRWADVPKELRKWNKAGGRELAGLTKRREAEARLI